MASRRTFQHVSNALQFKRKVLSMSQATSGAFGLETNNLTQHQLTPICWSEYDMQAESGWPGFRHWSHHWRTPDSPELQPPLPGQKASAQNTAGQRQTPCQYLHWLHWFLKSWESSPLSSWCTYCSTMLHTWTISVVLRCLHLYKYMEFSTYKHYHSLPPGRFSLAPPGHLNIRNPICLHIHHLNTRMELVFHTTSEASISPALHKCR